MTASPFTGYRQRHHHHSIPLVSVCSCITRLSPLAFALLTGRVCKGRALLCVSVTMALLIGAAGRRHSPSLPSPCPCLSRPPAFVRGRFIHTLQGDTSCKHSFNRPPHKPPCFTAHAPGRQCLTVRLTACTNTRPVVIVPRSRAQMKWRSARSRSAGAHTSTTITPNSFARAAATSIAAFRPFEPPRRPRAPGGFFFPLLSPLLLLLPARVPGLLLLAKGQTLTHFQGGTP